MFLTNIKMILLGLPRLTYQLTWDDTRESN